MQQHTLTRFYDIHSWTGLVMGLFLFAICFSGTVALFYHEMKPWEAPDHRLPITDTPPPIDALLADAIARSGGDVEPAITIRLPEAYEPGVRIFLETEGPAGGHVHHDHLYDPATGDHLGAPAEGAGRFLLRLHTDLHLPSPWGRYIVGIAGVIFLVSVVSGVMLHRKILKNLLVFRNDRSVRLAWTDTHNVLGVWGLPFHIMIAFTGVFLGLAGLFLSIVAVASFGGDRDLAIETLAGVPAHAQDRPAAMASLDAVLADARQRQPDGTPTVVRLLHWGDAGAEAHVFMERYRSLDLVTEHRYRLAEGTWRESWSLGQTPGGRIYTTFDPLHYGTYAGYGWGGVALKWLYAVLGLACSVLVATGLMIWIERRRQRAPGSHRVVSALVVGGTAGMAVATAAALALHHPLAEAGSRVVIIGWAYFGTWAGAALYAVARADDYRVLRQLFALTGALLAIAPVTHIAATGGGYPMAIGPGSTAAVAMDLALAGLAAAVFWARAHLPRGRPAPTPARDTGLPEPASPAE